MLVLVLVLIIVGWLVAWPRVVIPFSLLRGLLGGWLWWVVRLWLHLQLRSILAKKVVQMDRKEERKGGFEDVLRCRVWYGIGLGLGIGMFMIMRYDYKL